MSKLLACSIVLSLAACGPQGYGSGASSARPPAPKSGVVAEKWDHFCASFTNPDNLTSLLDDASTNGWEMVTMVNQAMCFKRRHADAPPSAALNR